MQLRNNWTPRKIADTPLACRVAVPSLDTLRAQLELNSCNDRLHSHANIPTIHINMDSKAARAVIYTPKQPPEHDIMASLLPSNADMLALEYQGEERQSPQLTDTSTSTSTPPSASTLSFTSNVTSTRTNHGIFGGGDKQIDAILECYSESNMSFETFKPSFVRPLPDLLPVADWELLWLNFDDSARLLWDNSPSDKQSMDQQGKLSQLRDLFQVAFTSPLNPAQQQQLIHELKSDTKLVFQCGLTPKKVSEHV